MVEPRCSPRGAAAAGFTLAELLVALAILLFGITSLVGALGSSVANRRTTDARLEMSALCDAIVHRLQHDAVAPGEAGDLPRFVPLRNQPAAGFPGMRWSATAVVDDTRPDLWLVTVEVRWPGSEPLDVGDAESGDAADSADSAGAAPRAGGDITSFQRVLPRQLPLRDRVVAFRSDGSDTADR